MKELEINTRKHTEFIDITGLVQDSLSSLGLRQGTVTVFVPHTTAGIMINENADPDVLADIEKALERMAPWQGNYSHGEGNAAAHVKTSLLGSSAVVPVENGRLRLGTWQSIFFCEFDGPRQRKVWLV
jgi:secondary thiamine-phosphate synthase enzyme